MTSTKRQFQIALTGLFAALAFVVGWVHLAPNLEFVTFTVFASGYLGGPVVGFATGATLAVLQALFWGGAGPFLLTAQIVGFGSYGLVGSLFTGVRVPTGVFAGVGAMLTVWYQVLVNLSLIPGSGLTVEAIFVAGIWFAAAHVAWNAFAFEAGRFLLSALDRHPAVIAWRKSGALPARPGQSSS